MYTVEKLQSLAKANKSRLLNYFYFGKHKLNKQLEVLKRHELNALLFLTIDKPMELRSFLKCSFFMLEETINNPSYERYSIAKKKGGAREIFAPSKDLKAIQKRLNYFLQAYYLSIKPSEVHGFVVKPNYLKTYCNIVANATAHVHKKYVLNIDLKDFFPSISASRVKHVFTSAYFNFNEQIATAFTLLSTFEGKLPIGAPCSPVISNFICLPLDSDLKAFCNIHQLTYSRYADDLTFSADAKIDVDTILDIINVITNNNFTINEKKLRLKSSNRKQTVTGLTVNEKVNVDRKLLKKIRAMLHDFSTNGIDIATQRHFNLKTEIEALHKTKFTNRLEGYINFIGQVKGKEDALYIRYKSTFDKMVDNGEKPSLVKNNGYK